MMLAHMLAGHGPAHVVMLHDWLGDSANYDAAMPYFDAAALTIARVDLPGYGASRAHALGALDSQVLAVADHLGWQRFHLVAHSMSTVIAQRIARSPASSRLQSLTLVTPVTPGTDVESGIADFLRTLGHQPALRRDVLASQWGTRLSVRWLDWKLERWAASSDPAAVAAYVELFTQPALPTTRADVALPVLVVTGADDAPPFARAAVEPALRAVWPDIVVEVCASAGHYPMQETPPLFAALVERFITAARSR